MAARHNVGSDAEHALIAATLGFTTLEVVKIWRDAAPSLEHVRSAPDDDIAVAQRLLDANYLGAGLAIMIGGTVSYLSASWIPLILSLGTVAFMAMWYRMVFKSDHTMMLGEDDNGPHHD